MSPKSNQDSIPSSQPEVARLVKDLREMLQLSQQQFANELGVTFATLNRWENGHANPSPLAMKQIGQRLDQVCNSPDVTLRERARAMHKQHFLSAQS
jgi:putative transcriptional regulator